MYKYSAPKPYYSFEGTKTASLLWRCRLPILFLVTLIVFIIITLIYTSISSADPNENFKTLKHAGYLDPAENPAAKYSFTAGEQWYNNGTITADDENWERYLKEVRQDWILSLHDSNDTYHLDQPDLEDPSMGQARVIREIFNNKRNGFFVECGAYDGETRSNTLYLERFLGWTGLLIEADPINFNKMAGKNRRAYLSPTCLSIEDRPGLATFLMADNIGRLHDPHDSAEENTADVAHTGIHIKVQCFPLYHYLAALGVKTVDYFSLDIEGKEIDVLETIPFEKVDIKTLSVEHVHNLKGRKYLIDFMEKQGYYVRSFVERSDNLANDVIFAKRES